MSLLLNVPFSEKDKAKALGAKWNPKLKKWYAEGQYEKFKQWFQFMDTNLIILDHLYIIIGEQMCFRCRHKTTVISLATDSYIDLYDDEPCDGDIHFIDDVDNLPTSLQAYVSQEYGYYKGYSKTIGADCWGNHCNTCKTLQGNFYLYFEPDSPFFIDGDTKAKKLKLLKIKLPYDIELSGNVSYGSKDDLIARFASKKDLSIVI